MKVDYHLHTSRCGHASGTPFEYLKAAEEKRLDEIGFADHFPIEALLEPHVHSELLGSKRKDPVYMHSCELNDYIADIKKLQAQASIPVKLAAEVDYLPGREQQTAEILSVYPFDYTIGSVHFLDGWDFTHPASEEQYQLQDIDELYDRYFTLIRQLAQSGLFDIVGHLDVIKKFSYFPRQDWSHLVDQTCRVLKKEDICVELNTSGWRAPVKEAYPGVFLLAKCLELGVPVTLGSDAHRPGDVGSGLQRAILVLKKLGFREIAVFSARVRTMHPL